MRPSCLALVPRFHTKIQALRAFGGHIKEVFRGGIAANLSWISFMEELSRGEKCHTEVTSKAEPVAPDHQITPFFFAPPGLRGLQVYQLHRAERPNYRLRCLQWLRQPQWPSWDWNHISCPCSWQQGLWDLRFQPIHIGDASFLSLGASPLSHKPTHHLSSPP